MKRDKKPKKEKKQKKVESISYPAMITNSKSESLRRRNKKEKE